MLERCWDGYERVPNKREGEQGSCRKEGSVNEEEGKKDACYPRSSQDTTYGLLLTPLALLLCRKS